MKSERVKILMAISERDEAAFKEAWSTRPREVLLEELTKKDGVEFFTGYTREYVVEYIPNNRYNIGDIVRFE